MRRFQRSDNVLNQIKSSMIHHAEDGDRITSSKGNQQSWMIDLRPLLLDPEALEEICSAFWGRYEQYAPVQIGGMEVAAVPLVTALILTGRRRGLAVNGFLIRKDRKRTGLGRKIEGNLTSDPIIIVDDIVNSSKSLEKVRLALKQEGREIDRIFTIIDYMSSKGKVWKKKHQIATGSLFKLSDFDLTLAHGSKGKLSREVEISWFHAESGAFPYHVVPKSTPLLVGDRLLMGTDAGDFICLNATDGSLLWRYKTNTIHPKGIWSSPSQYDGKVFFGGYDGNLYCLDIFSGRKIWQNPCADFIGSSPLIVPDLGLLYIGLEHNRPRMMGSNAAFRLDTGARVWEVPQKKYQHGSACYCKSQNTVIFGNADHDITAYEATTGKGIWKYKTTRSIKYPPEMCDLSNSVVAASFDGCVYILDAASGESKGKIRTNDICYTQPLVHDGIVYVGSGDKHLYIHDISSNTLLKKINLRSRVYGSPRIIGGNVMLGTNGGKLFEIGTQNHDILGEYQLPEAITNAVSYHDRFNLLYVSTCMNEVFAMKFQ